MIVNCKTLSLLLLVVPMFMGISPARADIYRYVDAEGVMHFTDVPNGKHWELYYKETPPPSSGANSYRDIIHQHASANSLEEALVKAVIKVESDYQPRIVSR